MKHPILAIVVVFAIGCGVGFTAPFRPIVEVPARVGDDDVRAYLDKKSGAAEGRSWRFYFDNQRPSDRPVFAGWPEVIADPIMWDWYDHAIRRGEHKEWQWVGTNQTTGTALYNATSASTIVCKTNLMGRTASVCGMPLQMVHY